MSTPALPVFRHAPLTAAAWVLVSLSGFSIMDAILKHLAETGQADTFLLVFGRCTGGLAILLPFALARGIRPWRATRLLPLALRGLCLTGSLSGLLFALPRLPLVEIYGLFYLSPVMILITARIGLGEPLTARKWVAILLGLAGALIILRLDAAGTAAAAASAAPRHPEALAGALASLGSAMAYAVLIVMTRKASARESGDTINFYGMLIPSLIMLVPALPAIQSASPAVIPWFLLAGLFGTIGVATLIPAVRLAPLSTIAALEYGALIWGAGLGLLIFAEPLTLRTIIGSAIIVAGGLVSLWPDLVRGLTGRPAPPETAPS